jgi:glycosyltransferase involved in cell wall biosynthesis
VSAAAGGEVEVSVIIPAWHDAKNLAVLMPQLARISGIVDLIVCDASDEAEALNLTQQFGTMFVRCTARNRGPQMNAGVIFASANVLLFHPPDILLEPEHMKALQNAMGNPDVIGGAFHTLFGMMSLDPGKQSIFVRREAFFQLGGFTKVPFIEDIDFLRRLRRLGKTVLLDPPIRKEDRDIRPDVRKMNRQAAIFALLYKFGVTPERLQRRYDRTRSDDSLEQERAGT